MWGFMTVVPLDLEGRRVRPDPADAPHWVAVYQELITTCRQLIGERALPSQMAERLREFEERRDFWRGLLRE